MDENESEYKGTKWMDAEEIETLYFSPSYCHKDIVAQSIAIASLENRETSIIFNKLYLNHPSEYSHFILTEEETDAMIAALQENKKRWYNK